MKLMGFHLMPDTEFPENFLGEQSSVRGDIHLSLFAEWEHHWWPRPMDTAQRAAVPAFMAAE